MKPLFHPPMESVTVEGILHALSDPVRLQIYIGIAAAECPQNCSSALKMVARDLPKSSLSQHFKVLRQAGLIYSERRGVEMLNRTRCGELKAKFGSLVSGIIEAWQKQEKSRLRRRRSA